MDLPVWQQLAAPSCAGLRDEARAIGPPRPADVARLRRAHPPELVHAALQLAEARRKAGVKFGAAAAELWADPTGVEMASSALVAAHKAARFATVLGRGAAVLDLCCGIGGDAMALAGAGLHVTAVDLDPVRAWMAGLNAACATRTADVEAMAREGDPALDATAALHIDPARREEMRHGTRLFRLADLRPGLETLRALLARVPTAAIKLGPGVDCGELPPGHVQFISERGTLTQAVLWTGALAESFAHPAGANGRGLATHANASPMTAAAGPLATRTATLLVPGTPEAGPCALSLSGVPDRAPPVAALGRFVLEPDDAIERAGLQAALAEAKSVAMLDPRVGLFTADAPHGRAHAPGAAPCWFRAFEVVAAMPWNPRRVAAELRAHGAGLVEVKTRGRAVDPDALQRELSRPDGEPMVVFALRFGQELRAIIARRVPD